MKYDISDKVAFFSLYTNGKAIVTKGSYPVREGDVIDMRNCIDSVRNEPIIKKRFAVLVKPFDAISDEDAIVIARMITGYPISINANVYMGGLGYKIVDFGVSVKYPKYHIREVGLIQIQTDYLRQKGYLLSFRDYSPIQLIGMGWAKIVE